MSEVAASLPTAAVSAVSRLPAVRSLVAPMANWFGPGLADVVAVSVMLSVEPSGRVKRYSMVSPSLGLPAVRSTAGAGRRSRQRHRRIGQVRRHAGELEPEGETTSSRRRTENVVGAVISRRPSRWRRDRPAFVPR